MQNEQRGRKSMYRDYLEQEFDGFNELFGGDSMLGEQSSLVDGMDEPYFDLNVPEDQGYLNLVEFNNQFNSTNNSAME